MNEQWAGAPWSCSWRMKQGMKTGDHCQRRMTRGRPSHAHGSRIHTRRLLAGGSPFAGSQVRGSRLAMDELQQPEIPMEMQLEMGAGGRCFVGSPDWTELSCCTPATGQGSHPRSRSGGTALWGIGRRRACVRAIRSGTELHYARRGVA